MERFVIRVNGWKPLTIITKRSILDVAVVLGPPLRTVSQENANAPLNETFINLLQYNRTERVREKRGRGKKIPSGTFVNEEIPKKEQQPGPSPQCNNLVKSSNDESSDEVEDDGTACKIWKIPWIELTER